MIKLIRNNQKIFIAAIGIFAMISFVVGFGGTGGTGRLGPVERELGRAGGKALTNTDAAAAHAELAAVDAYARGFNLRQTGGQSASVLDAYLGRDVAKNVLERPELFVLLRREALAGGAVPNPQQAQEVMDDHLGGTAKDGAPVDPPSPDSDNYALIREGIGDVVLVANYYDRVTAALKPSRPAVDRALAAADQTIQLSVVPLPANPITAPAPTPQQLDAQFKAYADTAPGRPDAGNPFGFGYRVPVRTRLQYLHLTRAAVEAAVAATKADYDWEVAGRKLLLEHPEQFAVSPPTTRATDTPGPAATPPYEKIHDQVLHALRDPLVQALQDQVQQFLATTMARDFATYQSAVAGGGAAPASPLGQPYDTGSYLVALTAAAKKQFGVQVDFIQTDDLTAAQLQDSALGRATGAVAAGPGGGDGSLDGYVADRALAFLAAATPKPPAAVAELMRPSPAFTEGAGDTVDLVRLSSVSTAAAAASLDAVRSAVENDVRSATAYATAKAEADRLAAAPPASMLALAAAAGHPAIATKPLSVQDATVDSVEPPLGDAAPDFLTQAFTLLDRYDPARNPYPTTVIAVPTQHRLFVAQIAFVTARWTPADYGLARLSAAFELQRLATNAARLGWFAPEAIVDRTGYKPAAPNTPG